MSKKILMSAAVLGACGVMIGTFGAHGLKPLLEKYGRLDTFETAVKYHFYHTLVLFALALVHEKFKLKSVKLIFWLYLAGILIFSGSLYVLCLTNEPVLGAVTPIGGVFLIVAWLMLFWNIRNIETKNQR